MMISTTCLLNAEVGGGKEAREQQCHRAKEQRATKPWSNEAKSHGAIKP